jgi:hypothetical protein
VLPGQPVARIGHADVELTSASLPGMVILAVTTRGVEHRATGVQRQDAFALSHRRRPGRPTEAIAVVCDGVGGLSRSDEAAELVSQRLATLGADGVAWDEAFAQVNTELRKVIAELPADEPPECGMATTAVAVSVCREADEWAGEVAWVGDSTLWHLSLDTGWNLMAGGLADDEPPYHSTDVAPMPSADGACGLRRFRIGAGILFVMSDGVANPLRWSRDVQEALAEWWIRPPTPFAFAEQVSFARKTHMDDRTVIGIWTDELA